MGAAAAVAGVAAVGSIAGGVMASQGAKSAAASQAGAARDAAGLQAQASTDAAQIQAQAQERAAQIQADASAQARAFAQDKYEWSRRDLGPYKDMGIDAGNQLMARLPELTAQVDIPQFDASRVAAWNPTQASLEATPGYQFTREQGLKSVNNAAAARGLGVSGAALKGAATYATGLADSTWQNVANNYYKGVDSYLSGYNAQLAGVNTQYAGQTNAYNKLAGVAAMGAGAAGGIANAGVGTASNYSNALMQGANGVANGITGSANATASGITGGANATANGITGAANAGAAGQIASSNAMGSSIANAGSGAMNAYYMNQLVNRQPSDYGAGGLR